MALIQNIRRISSPDSNFLQQSINAFNEQLKDFPFFSGELIEGVTVATSSAGTSIEHKLDRVPLGFIVIDKLADSRVWRLSKTSRNLVLRSSNSVTISLWVF